MISVSEARSLVEAEAKPLSPKKVKLSNALGLVLAENIFSPIHMPPFRQSNMDGYAINMHHEKTYSVIGEVKAGDAPSISLKPGEAARIFTGAMVPETANAVVVQEAVVFSVNTITLENGPQPGANIRDEGEQAKKGDLVLSKGCILNEAALGFLATLGFTKVKAYPRPKVAIITTGNELQKTGTRLKPGKVFESNSLMLQMALKRIGIEEISVCKVKDDFFKTRKAIQQALKRAEVVLVSGGISVGDYDFVEEALLYTKVAPVFYKVNQKPGKPLWFGKKGKRFVYALPGNPASGLTCFYLYVLPLLKSLMGHQKIHLLQKTAKASEAITNSTGKHLFLKGIVENGEARVLGGQASSMLNSYAMSNALISVPSDVEMVKKGSKVTYIQLDL